MKHRFMQVLALVPPCKDGRKPSRYSFLSEELAAMSRHKLQVHCVSPYVTTRTICDNTVLHPIPRTRNVFHTLRSAIWWIKCNLQKTGSNRIAESRTMQTIADVLAREQIDVVYSPFAWPNNSAGVLPSKNANVPVVVSLRGADVLVEKSIAYGRMLDPSARSQMQQTLQNVDHLIGVSRALVDSGIALGADAERVSVVLKGTDERQFRDGDRHIARKNLGLPDIPTILFVGNLIPRKGMYCLIEAFSELKVQLPELQLVMCGDGPELEQVQQAVRETGLEDSVVLAGRVDRETIPEYFRACDVFVLPSLTEGSGNVIVEASATARPCVGTNCAGIPDYVDDGVNGLLFEKNNSSNLANKLLAILQDDELAARMGRAGRERVERLHRYDQMIDHLVRIFLQVIEQKSNGAAHSAVRSQSDFVRSAG